jgi:hypothetical protein
MKKLLAITLAATLTGCAGANISSQIRDNGNTGPSMQTRCLDFSTGSSDSMNKELVKYDGWKLAYVSEYTTPNKSSTAAVMCFEKPTD